MRFLNIGVREIILLLVIMLILFGPNQMQENARKMARGIRKFIRSDTWRTFLGLVDDVNSIKDQVIRESGIQEVQDSLRGINRDLHNIDSELQQSEINTALPGKPDQEAVNNVPQEPAGSDESQAERS